MALLVFLMQMNHITHASPSAEHVILISLFHQLVDYVAVRDELWSHEQTQHSMLGFSKTSPVWEWCAIHLSWWDMASVPAGSQLMAWRMWPDGFKSLWTDHEVDAIDNQPRSYLHSFLFTAENTIWEGPQSRAQVQCRQCSWNKASGVGRGP